ncbi:MAG: nucleoside monophosphate kinase [Dehalococcoidales bacterium]|nr:nucleoside monophosphate kinase [Dehalococcoidales bacterium]
MNRFDIKSKAILLIGPTGCGKTPLGDLLETEGIGGRRCLHFDFGRELRASVGRQSGLLTQDERGLVGELLEAGALLEDEHFPIARKLLAGFISGRNADAGTIIVLNGLPRHVGQAGAMEVVVDMRALVSLECAPQVAWERVRTNSGGDRSERADDMLEAVERRLDLFRRRTLPMLEYYGAHGVPVLRVNVGAKTTASEMCRVLEVLCSSVVL